jgi:hypothetical protein
MVPEGTSLVLGLELVEERVSWRNGALRDTSRPVGPLRSLLKETVPMLHNMLINTSGKGGERAYNAGGTQHSVIGQSVNGIELEGVVLNALNDRAGEAQRVGVGPSED